MTELLCRCTLLVQTPLMEAARASARFSIDYMLLPCAQHALKQASGTTVQEQHYMSKTQGLWWPLAKGAPRSWRNARLKSQVGCKSSLWFHKGQQDTPFRRPRLTSLLPMLRR